MNEVEKNRQLEIVKEMLKAYGEDPSREGLRGTPKRFVESMSYLTSGYQQDIEKILREACFHEKYEEMVIVRDIEIYSLCEHHLLPFYGKCHVGYIPKGKLLGLSKIPKLVDAFARRFQVQERLTNQVSQAIHSFLEPHGVGVVVEAYHLCMMMRGVEKQSSYTVTSSMLGSFQKLETRNEFLSLIRMPSPARF